MKFIIITEDGDIYWADKVTDHDFKGVDAGILDIVSLDTGMFYHKDKWYPLFKWGE